MTAAKIVTVEFVDHGVHGEYGIFGKVVARTEVRGMTETERATEIAEMHAIVGTHTAIVEVEEIAACH
jgi:hypothetical protein